MRMKVNFRILKEITLNELNSVTEDNIWLCDLVEQVANKYTDAMPKWNNKWESTNYRKIKKYDMVISNIAKNNGWGAKQKLREDNFYKVKETEKIFFKKINLTLLYRLQEEE